MKTARYEIDPHNRLVIRGTGTKRGLEKFRQVLDGRFKIDEFNNLSYHIKAPLSRQETLPNQIRLAGSWSLTENHDLRLTLEKEARRTFGDQITLQGEILDAGRDSLLFAVTTTTKENTRSTYTLNLTGSWKADESNRLTFRAKKEHGRYDILALSGAWEIGKNHEITYSYEKARLIKKKSRTHTLVFRGRWDITKRLRLSYILSGSTDSAFDFTAKTAVFDKDYIKYEVGISLKDHARPVMKAVKLSGRWNLKKDVGLVFEVEYEGGKKRAITFGAGLELSRKILKGDGEAFLKILGSRRERAVYAGAAWRW